jgi:hypothetical protein
VLAMVTPDRNSRPLTFGSYLAASVTLS